jgi:hypothetical protein
MASMTSFHSPGCSTAHFNENLFNALGCCLALTPDGEDCWDNADGIGAEIMAAIQETQFDGQLHLA